MRVERETIALCDTCGNKQTVTSVNVNLDFSCLICGNLKILTTGQYKTAMILLTNIFRDVCNAEAQADQKRK